MTPPGTPGTSAPAPGNAPALPDVPVLEWSGCYDQRWGELITQASYAHPAKFSSMLIARIYQHGLAVGYWKKGDVIGDPFGGIGGGAILAAYELLQWVGVELEPRFVELARENIELHRRRWEQLGCPVPVILEGDSRRFAEIVGAGSCDAVVTSPAYEGSVEGRGDGIDWAKTCAVHRGSRTAGRGSIADGYGTTPGQIGALKGGSVDAVVSSPPYADGGKGGGPDRPAYMNNHGVSAYGTLRDGYGDGPGQIGNLAPGQVDAVVSSPPYAEGLGHGGGRPIHQPNDAASHTLQGQKEGYGGTVGQIGDCRGGSVDEVLRADAIVTSPPYADTAVEKSSSGIDMRKNWETYRASGGGASFEAYCRTQQRHSQGYGATTGQIAALGGGSVDAVVTSPPYGDTQVGSGEGDRSGWRGYTDAGGGSAAAAAGRIDALPMSGTSGGGGETYWQAMHQVYAQCFLALKPGGVMAIVVKDYVKDKKRVPLCDDTLRLLVHLGFEPVERVRALLVREHDEPHLFVGSVPKRRERKSFFRRLAEKKGSPRIDWEEVLIVRRPAQ